jgi:hypothetical protein
MRHKERLRGLGARCGIKMFFPPDGVIAIAANRTEGMVRYFWEYVLGCSFIAAHDALDRLVRSAYLQGIADAAYAMERNGWIPPEERRQ